MRKGISKPKKKKKIQSDKPVPAPGLKGVAGSFVEISFHGDAVSCISVEIHDGVIIGDVLEMLQS